MKNVKRSLVAAALFGALAAGPGFASIDSTQDKKDKHDKKERVEKEKGPDKADHKEKKEKKAHHKNGKGLLGEKIKSNGRHSLEKKGDYEAMAEVKDGKVAGVKVKHAKKGDLPVKKYKTKKQMAMGPSAPVLYASFAPMQQYVVDTIWIGYAYVDEWGYEEIYWFPYDMIYDGDTGAVWWEEGY